MPTQLANNHQLRPYLGGNDWEMAYLGDPESELGWYFFLDWQMSEGSGIPILEGTPGREDTIQRYEELTGWKVKHMLYQDVLAALRYGVIFLKIQKNFGKLGVARPSEDIETNNICTRRLASLLDLPAPGPPERQLTRMEDVTVTVQFHLTGPGGSDWYIVSDKGKGSRHEGTVENPNVTMTISAKDWAAIQSGEMDRIHAWTGGKLKIAGDMGLLMQLEPIIAQFS